MSLGPRLNKFPSLGPHGFHRLSYVEWGEADNPHIVVCVHGLTRNARDFDELARALASKARVVCLDVAGRGGSDWLEHKEDYGFSLYVADAAALLARISPGSTSVKARRFFSAPTPRPRPAIDWVGTSMGGVIGMLLAAQAGSPVRKLLLNDVGPVVTGVSLQRIGQYVGKSPPFSSMDAAEKYIREVSATFGPLTDAQWRHLTVHSVNRQPDGQYTMAYDPELAAPFRKITHYVDTDMWAFYDLIRCPTFLIRGAQSDLLTRETAQQMTARGPHANMAEIPGVGHAPMLMDAAQIALVKDFLLAH